MPAWSRWASPTTAWGTWTSPSASPGFPPEEALEDPLRPTTRPVPTGLTSARAAPPYERQLPIFVKQLGRKLLRNPPVRPGLPDPAHLRAAHIPLMCDGARTRPVCRVTVVKLYAETDLDAASAVDMTRDAAALASW
ncbi:hypothetical protein GCM10010331_16830 [Streptomyces xanthochromogenes]|nr:hypothetical protein GCM10010331_16830 [Streptomyces xanthochromogenes]